MIIEALTACSADQETALELDQELRFLLGGRAHVQRAMGAGLCRILAGPQLMKLGYARPVDYVRERLGISLREAEELAWIERRIERYPEVDRMWQAGKIGRSHVREILRRVKPEDDYTWSRLAVVMTVRTLRDRLPGQDDASEGPSRLDFELQPEMRSTWEQGLELASRLYGSQVGPSQFLEFCSMEFHSGASKALFDALDAEDRPTGSLMTLEELEALRVEGEREAERMAGRWPWLSREPVQPAHVPDFTLAPDATPWDIDRCLRDAVKFQQELDGLITRALWDADRWQVHRTLGFASFVHYCRERLDLCESSARGLIRLRRALVRCPEVAEAYATGVLSRSQVEQVVRVATSQTAAAWIEYGRRTTVRKLRDVVVKAVTLRHDDPEAYRHLLPPAPSEMSPEVQAAVDAALARVGPSAQGSATEPQKTCAVSIPGVPEDPYQVPCTTPIRMQVGMPQDVREFVDTGLGLVRMAFGGKATVSQCVEVLIQGFIDEWAHVAETAAKQHSIVERDGWVCRMPGCTSRASLQVHHIKFKSRGGSEDSKNKITLCSFHHLQGIHEGWIVAEGNAPDGIVWVLGIRPDGTPSQILLGDTILYSD